MSDELGQHRRNMRDIYDDQRLGVAMNETSLQPFANTHLYVHSCQTLSICCLLLLHPLLQGC